MDVPAIIGKYRIERELGRGGMGVVYRALDPVIERPVALKTILKSKLDPGSAEALIQRFKREAQAAGRIVHPHIVGVFDYGEDAERAYIAMEYVEGRGLDAYLAPGLPLELDLARPLIAQMLDALFFAHSRSVVHRDIKPSNILVTADGRVKLSDFGIAQIDASKLTQMGTVLGTPSYMSPEQFRGEATDHRADIFSAGVAIYEMLTGHRPFRGNNLAALTHAVLYTTPEPPTAHNPALDAALDAVIMKALSTDAAERFPSARLFAQALEAAFDGHVLEAGDDIDATVPNLPPPVAASPSTAILNTRKIDLTSITRKIDLSGPRATQIGPAAALGGPRPKILFVDDEERILNALKLLFKTQYEVHATTDAAEALDWLNTQRFHVLVSDQRMPNMNGTQLLARAKTLSPNTVRILLTGYSDLAAIVGSINEGEVYRFASKPWNTTEIRQLIAEASAIGLALEDAETPDVDDDKPEEAVLIVDEDREVYLATRDLFGSRYRVLYAANLLGALDVLKTEPVAVIVADIEGTQEHNRTLFKLLKREHPEILTIAMTAASDSELVIELINQAQLFRFLNKPLKLPTLQQHVAAAVSQYLHYKAQPKLLARQKAAVMPTAAKEDASVGKLILGTLRGLRGRLAGVALQAGN